MFKRKQPIIVFSVLIVILVLELLPYGAVLHFAPAPGEILVQTYSYFDLIPFGNADFGPFITAILTCVLLGISAINLFVANKKITSVIKSISLIAFVISLAPLLVDSYSVVGGAISAFLFVLFLVCSLRLNTPEKKE